MGDVFLAKEIVGRSGLEDFVVLKPIKVYTNSCQQLFHANCFMSRFE